jgi:heme/copper-type cytochrome/quinol oxidase subunit 4
MSLDDEHNQAGGNRASIAAIIFVILIVAGCVWLFEKLSRANDELNCVASGRHNCEQIDQ